MLECTQVEGLVQIGFICESFENILYQTKKVLVVPVVWEANLNIIQMFVLRLMQHSLICCLLVACLVASDDV